MLHKKLILSRKKRYFYRIDFFLIIFYKIYILHHFFLYVLDDT